MRAHYYTSRTRRDYVSGVVQRQVLETKVEEYFPANIHLSVEQKFVFLLMPQNAYISLLPLCTLHLELIICD